MGRNGDRGFCGVGFCGVVLVTCLATLGWQAVPESGRATEPLPSTVASVAGYSGAGNGLCCIRDAYTCYVGAMGSGNCVGQLPWECTCTNPGASCWLVTQVRFGDACVAGGASDTCSVVPIEGCWLQVAGTCTGGVGPWSWGGFCWTCGCDITGGGGAWNDTFNDCTTSTDCVFNPI